MGQSSFLSRWTGRPEGDDPSSPEADRSLREAPDSAKRQSPVSAWSISPALDRARQDLDGQIRVLEEIKRLVEERLAPYQRHLLEQRRNIEQCLKQLDGRLKPLRQYLEGQGGNLERVGMHLGTELKDQFEEFERFLADQRQILERATRYLDDQPRPLVQYLEDEQRAIEQVCRDLEEKLEPLGRFLREQQKLLQSLTEPRVVAEFEVLASYFGERQAALGRYAMSSEYRPQGLFAEFDGIYQKYTSQDGGKNTLLSRLLEQHRQSDLRLQESLKPLPREVEEVPSQRLEAAS